MVLRAPSPVGSALAGWGYVPIPPWSSTQEHKNSCPGILRREQSYSHASDRPTSSSVFRVCAPYGFTVVLAASRRRERLRSERGIPRPTRPAAGAVAPPSTSRRRSARRAATPPPRCVAVSADPRCVALRCVAVPAVRSYDRAVVFVRPVARRYSWLLRLRQQREVVVGDAKGVLSPAVSCSLLGPLKDGKQCNAAALIVVVCLLCCLLLLYSRPSVARVIETGP